MPSADYSGFRILNMFNTDSRSTITESVVESANSAIESDDSMADFTADPPRNRRVGKSLYTYYMKLSKHLIHPGNNMDVLIILFFNNPREVNNTAIGVTF